VRAYSEHGIEAPPVFHSSSLSVTSSAQAVILTWPWAEPAPAGQVVTKHETPAQLHDQVELLGIELWIRHCGSGNGVDAYRHVRVGRTLAAFGAWPCKDRIYRKLPLL